MPQLEGLHGRSDAEGLKIADGYPGKLIAKMFVPVFLF